MPLFTVRMERFYRTEIEAKDVDEAIAIGEAMDPDDFTQIEWGEIEGEGPIDEG